MCYKDDNPITFSEWNFIGYKVRRRDYRLDSLVKRDIDLEIYIDEWHFDKNAKTFLPNPIKEYPIIDYLKISEVDESKVPEYYNPNILYFISKCL